MERARDPRARPRALASTALAAVLVAACAACVFFAVRRGTGWEIPAFATAAVVAGLGALAAERSSRTSLAIRTTTRERQLDRLSETLREREEKAQALERRVDELTKLYRAISTVNSVPDPSFAHDRVVKAALELVGGDRGSLMLLDDAGETLHIRSFQGIDPVIAAETRVKLGEGVAGWVAQHGSPLLLVGGASEDARFERAENRPVHSALCVPLQCYGEVIGVLNLACSHASRKSTFDESDKNMAHIFAQHAAITARHALLWERERRS